MSDAALTLLYAQGGLVVVAKEAGPPTTGKSPDTPGSVEFALREQLGRRVWAVHQLDRHTSGCILFTTRRALVHPTAERLRLGHKSYLALCEGRPAQRFEVTLPIGQRRSPDGLKTFPAVVGGPYPVEGSREATTAFETLASTADGTLSLVLAQPQTGRTHQIRLHLAAVGHTIVGEQLHRTTPCTRAPRHLLHAWRLTLAANDTSPTQTFECPLPADFQALMAAHGLAHPSG